MSGAIALFVKTPGRSPLKTRLAAAIGRPAAEGWYAAACAATLEVVQRFERSCGAQAYWAVAEDDALDDPRWTALPRIAQGDGGLGARMARVHAELVARHGRGLLVGADAPQLTSAMLVEADAWLADDAPRLVDGPAADGGFWLFGGNRALPPADWEAVPYSCENTLQRFRSTLAAHGEWRAVAELRDVDTPADLAALPAALDALSDSTPAQRRLATLTRALLGEAVRA